MNEIANTEKTGLTPLRELEAQAGMFAAGAAMNLLQLGRVLCEAKPQVKHGQWEAWVETYAFMPMRRAQEYMQAWRKFGHDARAARLSPGQITALLPMSDEERESVLSRGDVEDLSVREIREEVMKAREEARAEALAEAEDRIQAAYDERDEARRLAAEAENREPEAPQELLDELEYARKASAAKDDQIAGLHEQQRDMFDELSQLRRDNAEMEQLLQDQQEAMNRDREALYSMKSAQARGETGKGASDELTLEVFGRAVREFMGLVARMPYMATTFSGMKGADRKGYDELLKTVEGWTKGARRALNALEAEADYGT